MFDCIYTVIFFYYARHELCDFINSRLHTYLHLLYTHIKYQQTANRTIKSILTGLTNRCKLNMSHSNWVIHWPISFSVQYRHEDQNTRVALIIFHIAIPYEIIINACHLVALNNTFFLLCWRARNKLKVKSTTKASIYKLRLRRVKRILRQSSCESKEGRLNFGS